MATRIKKGQALDLDKLINDELNDDEYAIAYLNAAIEDEDPRGLLIALRRIAEAKGIGMSKLAKAANIDRAGLYRTLSEQGNPSYLTLLALLQALGFKLTLEKKARLLNRALPTINTHSPLDNGCRAIAAQATIKAALGRPGR